MIVYCGGGPLCLSWAAIGSRPYQMMFFTIHV